MPKKSNSSPVRILKKHDGDLSASDRHEALTSALDIAATTTKLQGKEAVKQAKAEVERLKDAYYTARTTVNAAVNKVAEEKVLATDVIARATTLITLLAGEAPRPEEVLQGAPQTKRRDNIIHVVAHTVLDFNIERREGNTTTNISPQAIELEFDAELIPELFALLQAADALCDEHAQATAALRAAEERLANHPDQVDAVRVQLQRQRLSQMGGEGQLVLAKVDELLKASAGDSYLALL